MTWPMRFPNGVFWCARCHGAIDPTTTPVYVTEGDGRIVGATHAEGECPGVRQPRPRFWLG